MDGKTSIQYLQTYIKQKDYKPELKKITFLSCPKRLANLLRQSEKIFCIKTATALRVQLMKKYGM